MEKFFAFVLIGILLFSMLTASFIRGGDQACASAKECPDGFRARFIEAGCLCVPVRKDSK